MKNKNPLFFILLGIFVAVVSCNREDKRATTSFATKQEQVAGPSLQGTYSVVLKSINQEGTDNNATGIGNINIDGENMLIKINMTGLTTVAHKQGIYVGNSCPDDAEDENGDGLIDESEGKMAYGDLYIPMGADRTFPPSSSEAFIFSEKIFVPSLLDQLEDELILEGKVFIVHAVDSKQKWPIACGVINRLTSEDDPK